MDEKLHEAMAARVADGRLPGLVMLVARGDEVIVEALGTTAFGGREPMARDTAFRIASLTKPIVAAAAMTLVEDGSLSLDAPVDAWLPELADRRVLRAPDAALDDTVPADRPITVEDLLTYRMGYGLPVEPTFDAPLPVWLAAKDLDLVMAQPDPRTPHGVDEWTRRFGTLPLMHQPGERWMYNVSGLVLGVLVARAASASLPEVLEQRILAPLGMAHTAFRTDGPLPPQYMTNFGTRVMEEQPLTGPDVWSVPPVFPSAASGLVSTADDLWAFARMMRDSGAGLLTPGSVAAMTRNHLTPAQIAGGGMLLGGRGWGYGMAVAVAPDEVSAVPGRYGWEGGSGTSWFNDPATDVTAILLTQVSDVLFDGTLTEFGRLALG
jgi:CubicO group peptidase (beta-lactamase class C family)